MDVDLLLDQVEVDGADGGPVAGFRPTTAEVFANEQLCRRRDDEPGENGPARAWRSLESTARTELCRCSSLYDGRG